MAYNPARRLIDSTNLKCIHKIKNEKKKKKETQKEKFL